MSKTWFAFSRDCREYINVTDVIERLCGSRPNMYTQYHIVKDDFAVIVTNSNRLYDMSSKESPAQIFFEGFSWQNILTI